MKKAFVIGIAGGTGSGKTTLAKRLKNDFKSDITLMCQDNYYKCFEGLSFEERTKLNYDHPNAFDIDLLVSHILDLSEGKNIFRPVYSFTEHRRANETVFEEARKVILLEGILIFENPNLLELMDLRIFVDTDADIRFARRLIRDTHDRGRSLDAVIEQYMNTVKPMHEAFVEPSKKNADIIIPEGGMNHAAFSMLVEKIKSVINTMDIEVLDNASLDEFGNVNVIMESKYR